MKKIKNEIKTKIKKKQKKDDVKFEVTRFIDSEEYKKAKDED